MGKKNDITNRKKAIQENESFKIVEGGLRPPRHTRLYEGDFVMAEITDTRLMGVTGLHVCRGKSDDRIHQFFYLDAEEYGLDEYISMINCSDQEVEAIKRDKFGALGGSWNEVNEKEVQFFLKDFILFTGIMGLDFPEPKEEYMGYADIDVSFTQAEFEAFWSKMCVPIRNDFELVNYFLMRCAGRDDVAAGRLSSPYVDVKFLELPEPSTLFRNSIRPGAHDGEYICNLLVDNGDFIVITCRVAAESGKVVKAEKLSEMAVTAWEASLILRRNEYVVYNKYDGNQELLDMVMHAAFDTLTCQEYDAGTLYMIFNKNNDHVREQVYRLDRDTMAAVLLTDSGELVIAGDSPDKTGYVEDKLFLALGSIEQPMRCQGAYKFHEQVVGAFLDSGYFEFKDYLEYIQSFEEK